MESPQSHKLEFGQTSRVAGEGAPGKQKQKIFPIISYIRGQTLKPSASPSNEQRKPGGNQSLENGLGGSGVGMTAVKDSTVFFLDAFPKLLWNISQETSLGGDTEKPLT